MEDISPTTTQPSVTPVTESTIQTQPVEQPIPSTTEPTPPVESKKSFPIVAIILIIFLTIAGVVIGKKLTSPHPKTNQQGSQSSETGQNPKPSKTQTYSNAANKFSLQYPTDLHLKESSVGMGVTSIELRSPQNMDENYLADIQMLSVPKYLAKTIGQDFDQYYSMKDNSSQTIAGQGMQRVMTKIKNRSINNLRAFEFKTTSSPPQPNEEPTIGAYIEMGDNILIMSTQEHNRDKLEAILANFKYPL